MTKELRRPDDYEAEFMGTDGVVHREKLTFPTWFRTFLGLALAFGLGMGFFTSLQTGDMTAVAMLAAMTPVMFFFMMMASTLRVTVTKDEVAVQYGPIGPKIPIDAIEHCEAEDYQFWKYGGYGIRYSVLEGAWCYNMVGDKGKAVRVHYRTKSGALKKVLIASPRHHILADAINRARMAKGHDVPEHLAPDEDSLGIDDEVIFAEVTGGEEVEDERESESVEEVTASPS